MDFVSDQLASGRRLARFLDEDANHRSLLASIVCGNGPELTSKAMFFWARERTVTLAFIQPGKPMQNAFIESFNGKFRDSCLNQHCLLSLDRLPTNELVMTQELIANMLGVRREGVTASAGKLQKAGMISYHRGHIHVLDRSGLEERVCERYHIVKREYSRLLSYHRPR